MGGKWGEQAMRSCVNMQLAYYLGTIAESLCHIFGMPSSKFNEIVAAFSCQGNRARSAVRMSRRSLSSALLASSTPVRVEKEKKRERERVIRAPSSSLALACLLRRCPAHKRTASQPPKTPFIFPSHPTKDSSRKSGSVAQAMRHEI